MTTEIGELALEQYLALATSAAGGHRNPFLERALALHGDHQAATDAAQRFAGLIGQFSQRFGKDRSIRLYESPGRVNLMGMHIDHRGGVVNPVATPQRLRAVCGRRDDDVLCARSLFQDYGEGAFRISDRLPAKPLGSLSQWLDFSQHQASVFGGGKDFINYFACGPLYAACFCYPWGTPFAGADFLFDSDLPPSSGLSSSSAVVLLATDFFLHCNPQGREELSVGQLLEIYGYGEWYIGTRGGTGDHAAIKLCQRGAIQPVITTPSFRAGEPAPIPSGYEFCLYQSGDEANKSVEPAKTGFNAPIVAYQAAEMILTETLREVNRPAWDDLLEQRRSMDAKHHRVYIGDVVNDQLLSEASIYDFLQSLPQRMSQQEIFERFEEHGDVFRAGMEQTNEPEGGYRVRQVCGFGFSECSRAKHASVLLRSSDIEGFAQMMNRSQLGDRVEQVEDPKLDAIKSLSDASLSAAAHHRAAIRDLAGDYHVSTTNVDRLVDLCLACPPVLAARMSGAGLGGMVIVLGEKGFDAALDPTLQRQYYEPLGRGFEKIPITPSHGAAFY